MAFRRWRRCQVVPGRRYRTGDGFVEVVRVDEVEPPSITELEAHEAGYSSRAELLGDLRGSPEWPVYRLCLRRVDEADPRRQLADSDQLTAIDVDGIERALDRLDGGARAPWTRAALGRHRGAPRGAGRRSGGHAWLRAHRLQGQCPQAEGTGPDDQPGGGLSGIATRTCISAADRPRGVARLPGALRVLVRSAGRRLAGGCDRRKTRWSPAPLQQVRLRV